MKNILFVIAVLFSIAISAQSTTPRTGVSPYTNLDNTGRALNYHFVMVKQDAAGLDTVKLYPQAYKAIIEIDSLLDSVTVNVVVNTSSYNGDILEFHVNNTSTGKALKFAGAYLKPSALATVGVPGTLYLTASKPAIIVFTFNGSVWVETSRVAATL